MPLFICTACGTQAVFPDARLSFCRISQRHKQRLPGDIRFRRRHGACLPAAAR